MITELLNIPVSSMQGTILALCIFVFGCAGAVNLIAVYYNIGFFECMDKLIGCEEKMTDWNIYGILVDLVGTPQNDIQTTMLYMVACIVSSLMFFAVIYLFRLATSIMGASSAR